MFRTIDNDNQQLGVVRPRGPLGKQFLFVGHCLTFESIGQTLGKAIKFIGVHQAHVPLTVGLADEAAQQGGFATAGRTGDEDHGVTELRQVGKQVKTLHERRATVEEAVIDAVCKGLAVQREAVQVAFCSGRRVCVFHG